MAKEEIARGTTKLFEVYITDKDGNPQDPDTCYLKFVKGGEYSYDSPRGPFSCSKVGTTGYWGIEVLLSESITLGDWIAHFYWYVSGVYGAEKFPFIIVDKVRPYLSKSPIAPNVKVIA